MTGLAILLIIFILFLFIQYYNPHRYHGSTLRIYTYNMVSNRTFCFLQMGDTQKEKKVGDRYNVLRKGKVIFWNVSESELFDIMEDLAIESYYNQTLTSNDITYEPYIEELLNG